MTARFLTESGVSAATGDPFVRITWEGPELAGQLTVDETREIARTMMTAAEAAVSDAALMAWLTGTMEMDRPRAAAVLGDFRVHRARFKEDNDADAGT